MRRTHRFGIAPRQQVFDVDLFVPVCDGSQDAGQVTVWLDPAESPGLDQGCDDGPVLCAGIMPGEERVFAIERNGTDCPLDGVEI